MGDMDVFNIKESIYIVYKMNTNMNFSISHCKSLQFIDAIKYIEDYFIPLDDGNHAYKTNGKWIDGCLKI